MLNIRIIEGIELPLLKRTLWPPISAIARNGQPASFGRSISKLVRKRLISILSRELEYQNSKLVLCPQNSVSPELDLVSPELDLSQNSILNLFLVCHIT